MAGSDSDDLDDLLLEAGGAGKAKNKRVRDEQISGDSDQEASQLSEEVSQEYQAPAKKAKPPGKKRKTATGSDEGEKEDSFNPDTFTFDGYGKDLIRDSTDKVGLEQMTELDREWELSQRAEARDREIERRQHAKLLQQTRAQQAPTQLQVY